MPQLHLVLNFSILDDDGAIWNWRKSTGTSIVSEPLHSLRVVPLHEAGGRPSFGSVALLHGQIVSLAHD